MIINVSYQVDGTIAPIATMQVDFKYSIDEEEALSLVKGFARASIERFALTDSNRSDRIWTVDMLTDPGTELGSEVTYFATEHRTASGRVIVSFDGVHHELEAD